MRTLIALLFIALLAACNTMPKAPVYLKTDVMKFSAASFFCPPDPGAWAINASDTAIAINERVRLDAGQACRQALRTVCLSLQVNGQILPTENCPVDLRAKRETTASETPGP